MVSSLDFRSNKLSYTDINSGFNLLTKPNTRQGLLLMWQIQALFSAQRILHAWHVCSILLELTDQRIMILLISLFAVVRFLCNDTSEFLPARFRSKICTNIYHSICNTYYKNSQKSSF